MPDGKLNGAFRQLQARIADLRLRQQVGEAPGSVWLSYDTHAMLPQWFRTLGLPTTLNGIKVNMIRVEQTR